MNHSIIFSRKNILTMNVLTKVFLLVLGMCTLSSAATNSFGRDTMTMEFHGEKLTAIINDVPLKQVIKELSESTGIVVVWQGQEAERVIQLRFTDLSLVEAIRKILWNENYILYYTPAKGKDKLEKVLIVPQCQREEKVLRATREAKMHAMEEVPEEAIAEWHTIPPDNFDQQVFLANLEEQLVLQGETEAADALREQLANEPNFYEED
jgi:hypothetical protein